MRAASTGGGLIRLVVIWPMVLAALVMTATGASPTSAAATVAAATATVTVVAAMHRTGAQPSSPSPPPSKPPPSPPPPPAADNATAGTAACELVRVSLREPACTGQISEGPGPPRCPAAIPCARPHTGHVPGRPGRVPPAGPVVPVPAPALLPPHRRVGRAAAVRGQGVVRRPGEQGTRHGRHRGRHVVSVQRGVGQVRLQAKVLGQVVRFVQGRLRSVGVCRGPASLDQDDGQTGTPRPLQGERLPVRVSGGRTKVSVAASGGRRRQPVRRRGIVHVYRSGHMVPDVGDGRDRTMLLRTLCGRSVRAECIDVQRWQRWRAGPSETGVRRKRSAGDRGVSVHRLQSDRQVVGPWSTGAAATSAPVVGGIGAGAGGGGGRHVVVADEGGDDSDDDDDGDDEDGRRRGGRRWKRQFYTISEQL